MRPSAKLILAVKGPAFEIDPMRPEVKALRLEVGVIRKARQSRAYTSQRGW